MNAWGFFFLFLDLGFLAGWGMHNWFMGPTTVSLGSCPGNLLGTIFWALGSLVLFIAGGLLAVIYYAISCLVAHQDVLFAWVVGVTAIILLITPAKKHG